jgi:hypothetical protein
MKRLGSPPHHESYFTECLRALKGRMRIVWALHENEPIAGLLGYSCGARVSIVNIVSDERFWHLRPNDVVHWEYIKWACEAGYRYFDFGSVRYEGQGQFKEKWGCVLEDSAYYYLTLKPGTRYESFDSSSRRMALAGKIWKQYVPLAMTKALGPVLRKHLLR